MKIGIIAAMSKEYDQLLALLENTSALFLGGNSCVNGLLKNGTEVLLMHSGIGKVNAALGTLEMINEYLPDIVISTGCAGGADASLEIGHVVVSNSCQYHDVYCGPENLAGQVQGMPSEFFSPINLIEKATNINSTIHAGKIATGDCFVDSVDKMKQILQIVPDAIAVDMESAAIAHTCHLYNVPFISFRVISDIPLKGNNAADYEDFWATMADKSFNTTKQFIESLCK